MITPLPSTSWVRLTTWTVATTAASCRAFEKSRVGVAICSGNRNTQGMRNIYDLLRFVVCRSIVLHPFYQADGPCVKNSSPESVSHGCREDRLLDLRPTGLK